MFYNCEQKSRLYIPVMMSMCLYLVESLEQLLTKEYCIHPRIEPPVCSVEMETFELRLH